MEQPVAPPAPVLPQDAAAVIVRNRAAFSAYNVARIREMLRHLTPRKYKLFRQIPFWLHVNKPGLPGYMKTPLLPFGIYRFTDSGFWKQALTDHRVAEKRLLPFLSKAPHILGLYLMGSAGTLAQRETSDFDYWLVVDGARMGPRGRALLEERLALLEAYCRERYGQAVTFFLLDEGQVRDNRFAAMGEESSGSAQRTLLKEEFYRTFIMMAGKIPYWSVLPAGLDNASYGRWMAAAGRGRHLLFLPEDYIDLGNLARLDKNESLGALLWQMVKARSAPFKALLKAALVARYFFFEDDGFLCDKIKARYLGHCPGNALNDPYALVFEAALSFFQDLEDAEGLFLVRVAVFFRLHQGSGGRRCGVFPGERLLERYVQAWGWDTAEVARFSAWDRWPEAEKCGLERRVFEKISFIYELMRQAQGGGGKAVDMTDQDLSYLTNRVAGHFRKAPGKVPRCSSWLASRRRAIEITVAPRCSPAGDGPVHWAVYGPVGDRRMKEQALLFDAPALLQVAGWLVVNRLVVKRSGLSMRGEMFGRVTDSQAARLIREVSRFFSGPAVRETNLRPVWDRILVCLPVASGGKPGAPVRADFLGRNRWGEFFFESLAFDINRQEAPPCFHVAQYLWRLLRDGGDGDTAWRVISETGGGAGAAGEEIAAALVQFRKEPGGAPGCDAAPSADGRVPDTPLLLDRWGPANDQQNETVRNE